MNPLGRPIDSLSQTRDSVRRSRRWIWFFAPLAVLGLCAMISPWVYNLWQQLRPEQLAAARALWDQKGPKDYDLEYVIKEDDKPGADPSAGPEIENISVRVRLGKIESATRNSKPVPREDENGFGIEALFELIQGNLERDGQPGQDRSYAHARFDKQDGHPIHYVRRIMGSRQRMEIIIELASPNDAPVKKPKFPVGS